MVGTSSINMTQQIRLFPSPPPPPPRFFTWWRRQSQSSKRDFLSLTPHFKTIEKVHKTDTSDNKPSQSPFSHFWRNISFSIQIHQLFIRPTPSSPPFLFIFILFVFLCFIPLLQFCFPPPLPLNLRIIFVVSWIPPFRVSSPPSFLFTSVIPIALPNQRRITDTGL